MKCCWLNQKKIQPKSLFKNSFQKYYLKIMRKTHFHSSGRANKNLKIHSKRTTIIITYTLYIYNFFFRSFKLEKNYLKIYAHDLRAHWKTLQRKKNLHVEWVRLAKLNLCVDVWFCCYCCWLRQKRDDIAKRKLYQQNSTLSW